MAITVKHKFVSAIPDGDDASVVRPSNWNDTHELTGLGTMAEQNANNVAITGGTMSGVSISGYIPTSAEGVANGVATLDSNGQVPLSQIPPLGDLNYQGTWNASTNTPTLTSSVGTKGYYYVVSVAGTTNLNGITDWQVGDWAVYSGTAWQKIDNTDAVTSVNGKTGTVVLTNTDISGFGTMSTQNANAVAITGGTINGAVIGGSAPADITGNTITAATGFISQNYTGLPALGGNLKSSAGVALLNWDGAGSGNITINGGLNANPANKNVSIAPTGTGTATINPATAGTMNNMVIGGTTPLAITGTTITATTFSGSGASLTSIPNSALVNSAITINGVSTALGGSASVGTVTSVAATAGTGISVSGSPITGSGTLIITNTAPDQTVAISSGTGISVTGTYPNFTVTNTAPSSGGTVTSVAALTLGTTGTDLSSTVANGTTTPVITLQVPTASATNRGALSSADWSTFNGKQAALVSGTNIKTVNGSSLLGSGDVGTIDVSHGGTGATSATAYGVLCGGTTSTSAYQSVASVGTSGQVLTSNGAGALPTFQAAAGSFPSGTAMLFVQTSAPTGWTKLTTNDNAALRVVSGTASTGGTVAFTTAFSATNTVDGTAISTSQMPSHTHGINDPGHSHGITDPSHNHYINDPGFPAPGFTNISPVFGGTGYLQRAAGGVGISNSYTGISVNGASTGISTQSTGTGSTHNHTLTNLAVKYVDAIICTKN
jgi:hypothetical protein